MTPKMPQSAVDFIQPIPACIFEINRDGCFSFVSKSLCQFTGYKESELLGRSPFERMTEEDSIKQNELFLSAVQRRSPSLRLLFPLIRADGERVAVSLSAGSVFDSGGNLCGYRGILQDVSERCATEVKLREREERLSAICHSLKDLALIVTDDGVITEVLKTRNADTYAPRDSFLGRKLDSLLPVDVSEALMTHLDKVFFLGETEDGEYQVEITDKTRFYQACFSPCGKNRVLVLLRDISDLRETENRLRSSAEQFQQMFEQHSQVMYIINPKNLSIVQANRAAQKFYGYSAEEFREMPLSTLSTLSNSETRRQMQKGTEHGFPLLQFRHRTKNGKVREVEIAASPVFFQNRKCVYCIVRDITTWKSYEQEIKQDLETLEKKIGSSQSMFSSIFQRSQKMTEELRSQVLNPATGEDESKMDQLKKGIVQLAVRQESFRLFFEMENSTLETRVQEFSLSQSLEKVMAYLAILFKGNNKTLTLEVAPMPVQYMGDPDILEHILILLSRSLFWYQDEMDLKVARQDQYPGSSELHFSFQGNSNSISEKARKAFQTSRKLNTELLLEDTESYTLPLCRHLATMMGGTLEQGTSPEAPFFFSFSLSLPCTSGETMDAINKRVET